MKTFLLFFLLLFSSPLFAQTGLSGFDLRLYRSPADGSGVFNLHGSEVLKPGHWKTGFVLEHGHGLLAAINNAGQRVRVVNDMMTGNLGAALGIFPNVQTGLTIPVILFEKGRHIQTTTPFTTASLGDVALDLKLSILRERPIGFSFLSQTTVPTGSTSKFTGNRTVGHEARLIADRKIGRVLGVANVGFRTLGRTQANVEWDEMVTFGGGAAYTLPIQNETIDLMAEIDGTTVVRSAAELNTPLEWVFGARKRFKDRFQVQAGLGRGITTGVGGSEWRLVAGVHGTPAAPLWKKEPILLGQVYFAFGKGSFLSKYHPMLDTIAEQLKAKKRMKIRIRGHSDSEGTPDWNLALSIRRADNVKLYLIKKGIPAKQILIEGVGENEPAANNLTREGKSKNRRVEIWEM